MDCPNNLDRSIIYNSVYTFYGAHYFGLLLSDQNGKSRLKTIAIDAGIIIVWLLSDLSAEMFFQERFIM